MVEQKQVTLLMIELQMAELPMAESPIALAIGNEMLNGYWL